MYGYIYITTNNVNGRKYIGKHKSENFDESYKGSGVALEQAIKKYGKNNFSTELLEKCDTLQQLNECEKYWISRLNAQNNPAFYNIAQGGDGGCVWGNPENHPSLGKHYSEERVEKTAKYCRGSKVLTKDGVKKWVHRDELSKYFQDGWISTADENKKIAQERHDNFIKIQEERFIKKQQEEQRKEQRKQQREEREKQKEQKRQQIEQRKLIQEENRRRKEEELQQKKPRTSWCKGLTKDTDERVRKIAESKIGKPSKTRGQKRTDEQRRHLSEGGKGKHPRNEETIEKYKTTMKNKTEEEKELIKKHLSESHIGKIWINNGNQVLYINKEDFDIYEK